METDAIACCTLLIDVPTMGVRDFEMFVNFEEWLNLSLLCRLYTANSNLLRYADGIFKTSCSLRQRK